MNNASGTLEAFWGLSSPHGLCSLPPRGIVHYSTLKKQPPPSPHPTLHLQNVIEGVYEYVVNDTVLDIVYNAMETETKKTNIKYCVPCHNLLFNKLTVLKITWCSRLCRGLHSGVFLHSSLHLLSRSGGRVTKYTRTDGAVFSLSLSVVVLWSPNSRVMFWRVWGWHCGSLGHKNSWASLRWWLFFCLAGPPGVTVGSW